MSPANGSMGDTFVFTAEAVNTEYVLFVFDGYAFDPVKNDGAGVFVFEHSAFTQSGSRVVYVYPCDADGNKLNDNYKTARFQINSNGKLEPVSFLTEKDITIPFGEDFTVEWTTDHSDSSIWYNVYLWYGSDEFLYTTSNTEITIPAEDIPEEGTYKIAVYTLSDNMDASDAAVLKFFVKANVPVLDQYTLSTSSLVHGGTFSLSGYVNGNGSVLEAVEISVTNQSTQVVRSYTTIYPDSDILDLSDIEINTANTFFDTVGSYKISVSAQTRGGVTMHMLGSALIQISSLTQNVLTTPVINGPTTVEYGRDYVGEIYTPDAAADYFLVYVNSSTFYKPQEIAVRGSNTEFTIPAAFFMRYAGDSGSNFTIYAIAMSNDENTYAASADASKVIKYAGKDSHTALIHTVEMYDMAGNAVSTIKAGTKVEFVVETTTDVTAIRMKDGAGSFIINTWNSEYVDSGSLRIWTVTQKVNYAGGNNVSGANRMLTFYSMIDSVEYNSYNVSFYCVKSQSVGEFRIISPTANVEQDAETDLVVHWSVPDNTPANEYVLNLYHDTNLVYTATVQKNTCTIPGSYLIRDNMGWLIQIAARADGYAENSKYVNFTLKCKHEHLAKPVETVISCTNTGNADVHATVIRVEQACLDCGVENAISTNKYGTENHVEITLDHGTVVCNKCWYYDNAGYINTDLYYPDVNSITEKKQYYVYLNVNNAGKPTGIQKNSSGAIRQMEEGDAITVIDSIKNCYFIEYPVGNGYWWGFVSKDVLRQDDVEVTGSSPNQEIIDAVDNFMELRRGKGFGLISSEYELAMQILDEELCDNRYVSAFLSRIKNGWTDNIWTLFEGEELEERQLYKAAIYTILDNVIVDPIQTSQQISMEIDKVYIPENATAADVENTVYSNLLSCKNKIDTIKSAISHTEKYLKITLELLEDADVEIISKIKQLYMDVMNVEVYPSNLPLATALDNIKKFYKNGKNVLDCVSLMASISVDVFQTTLILNQTSIETIYLIKDSIDNMHVSSCSSQTHDIDCEDGCQVYYKNMLLSVIEEIENEYYSEILVGASEFFDQTREFLIKKAIGKLTKEALEEIAVLTGKSLVGSVASTMSIVDFVKDLFFSVTGFKEYIDACDDAYIILPLTGMIDCLYLEYVKGYRNDTFEEEDYCQFNQLHNIVQGCQILLNETAIRLTGNEYYKEWLQDEITHLKTCTIRNWEYNPMTVTNIAVPDMSWISTAKNTRLYSELVYTSLITEYWNSYSGKDKLFISQEITNLKSMSAYNISKMYIIHSKLMLSIDKMGDKFSLLFVNTNGDGVLVSWNRENHYGNNRYGYQYTFKTYSKEQVSKMLETDGEANANKISPKLWMTSNMVIHTSRCVMVLGKYNEYITETLLFNISDNDLDVISDVCCFGQIIANSGYGNTRIFKMLEKLFDVKFWGSWQTLSSAHKTLFEAHIACKYNEYTWNDLLN